MTYGSLALAGHVPPCREGQGDPYRCRPDLKVDSATPAPTSSEPIDPSAISAVPISPSSQPGAADNLPPRELAVRRADAVATSLCTARLTLSLPLTRVAAKIVETSAWSAFGFARVNDFARERLGRSGRWLRDLAILHHRMRALPGLEAALTGADGARPLGRVAALLIGRIASPASLQDWMALARGTTVRELREAVRCARSAGTDAPPQASDTARPNDAPIDQSGATPSTGPSSNPSLSDAATSCAADQDDDTADRTHIRVAVPKPVRAAFDEAVDLYRAVDGTEATVTSFIESLVAESAAGGHLPDLDLAPIYSGPSLAQIENALARSTNRWIDLHDGPDSAGALASARRTLRRVAAISRDAGRGTPSELLSRMRALVEIENDLESHLGIVLAGMSEDQAWSRLRFSGVGHYAEERLGVSRSAAERRVRAARALRRYPRLRRAYETERLGLEAVLIVARVLDDSPAGGRPPTVEEAWVARASEATVKRLRDEARLLGRRAALRAGAADGERPCHPFGDTDWHASLRRAPGTARRRVLRLGLLAAGCGAEPEASLDTDRFPDLDTALLPSPDVFLRLRLPADLAARFVGTIEAFRERLGVEAGRIPWDEPWPVEKESPPLPSLLAARMFSTRCRRIPAWVGLLAAIEEFVLTWDTDARPARRSRDRNFVRDGWRCAAPGCSSRRNLEDHHVVYRAQGGGDAAANRLTLCRFHHQRGEHGGLASCSGEAPLDVTWRLGRRDVGIWYRNERRIERPGVPASPGAERWQGAPSRLSGSRRRSGDSDAVTAVSLQ